MMTDAMAKITTITPDPAGAGPTGLCTAAFSGTVGTAVCATIISGYMPADNPLQANKTYTMVSMACVVACSSTGACPGALMPNGTGAACTCK
jgi:hypothetical protein